MTDEAVQKLLDGFVAAVPSVVPVVAVWVHGSLALGDFVPGRSDLDIVCVTDGVVPDPAALEQFHQRLLRSSPHGPKLHCTYMPVDALGEPALRHPTFAQRRYFDRPVTPVTRRELWLGNQALLGPSPQSLLPATTDEELAAFIRRDLEEFWYPVTAKRRPWYRDIWVDLALITKREALALLPTLEAPDQVVADIHHRRYGSTQPTGVDTTHLRTPNHTAAPNTALSPAWRARRGHLTRTFLRDAIPRLLASGSDDPRRLS